MKWVVNSTAVIVATAEGDRVFESIEDCPEALRNKIEKTLAGPNSRTKFITNRLALERMVQLVNELPPEVQEIATEIVSEVETAQEPNRLPPWYLIAGGFVATAAALVGLFLWAIYAAG